MKKDDLMSAFLDQIDMPESKASQRSEIRSQRSELSIVGDISKAKLLELEIERDEQFKSIEVLKELR